MATKVKKEINKETETPQTPELVADNILIVDDIVWAQRIVNGEMDLQQFITTCYHLADVNNNDEYRQKALRIKHMLEGAGYTV